MKITYAIRRVKNSTLTFPAIMLEEDTYFKQFEMRHITLLLFFFFFICEVCLGKVMQNNIIQNKMVRIDIQMLAVVQRV